MRKCIRKTIFENKVGRFWKGSTDDFAQNVKLHRPWRCQKKEKLNNRGGSTKHKLDHWYKASHRQSWSLLWGGGSIGPAPPSLILFLQNRGNHDLGPPGGRCPSPATQVALPMKPTNRRLLALWLTIWK